MAHNAIGYGIPSTHIEIMPATTPGAPNQPTLTALTSTSIQISWTFDSALNGGTPITDYSVYWDQGQGGESFVAAESTGLWGTFTTVDGTVQSGLTYSFWITAHNYIGEGL
jgi:hypothetical protein